MAPETTGEKVVCLTLTSPTDLQRRLHKCPHTFAGAKSDFCGLSPEIISFPFTPTVFHISS